MSEWSGRSAAYTYDALYRLVDETVSGDPFSVNGAVGYVYDTVGNRTSRTSTLPGVVSTNQTYTINDWLVGDTVDNNGNTTASTKGTDGYDFENRLISRIDTAQGLNLSIIYDGDGNRVRKTVNNVTTLYVVDDRNPTGYAQVLEEHTLQLNSAPSLRRVYTYGHDLISQDQVLTSGSGSWWNLSFYTYDGLGSVRGLTDAQGTLTDTYDYDAFGILVSQSSIYQTPTPNLYLYTGEQWDADLGFYYLRARYSNPETGRFWTMDSYEGRSSDPLTLHKYLYCQSNPINSYDPSGHFFSCISFSIASGLQIAGRTIIAGSTLRVMTAVAAFAYTEKSLLNVFFGEEPTAAQMSKIWMARSRLLFSGAQLNAATLLTALTARIRVHPRGELGQWAETQLAGHFVTVETIHLDEECFDIDSSFLAATLAHESTHMHQWINTRYQHEREAHQVESDTLRSLGIDGTFVQVTAQFPGDSNEGWIRDSKSAYFGYNVHNPAIH